MSKFYVNASIIATTSLLNNNLKIYKSREKSNVKVMNEHIKENDQSNRNVKSFKDQSKVSDNNSSIDEGNVNSRHQ